MSTFRLFTTLATCALALANPPWRHRTPTFNNPVIWNDLADIDLFRVDDTYYYSASSMHFSPGAPTLMSKDLVNWDLEDGLRAYARGVWASTLRYRQSNSRWYWIGCVDFNATYIYTSDSVTGPFEQVSVLNGTCFYDCGLLIDDDDTMYVTHGSTNLTVAQLTPDGLNYVKDVSVFNSTVGYIEGSRMYNRNGIYYIITVAPTSAQYILKSTSGPFGPYELGTVLNNTKPPSVFAGADTPHQGAFVDTPEGDWWYMAFVDVNGDATARAPVLSSIAWDDQDWPVLRLDANNTWPETLPYPVNSGAHTPNSDASLTGVDRFSNGILGPQYEWNHNPNVSQYSVSHNGVELRTATVTDDIYQAQNTLTRRTLGPSSSATILLDYSRMHPGDRTGLSIFRDSSAWIGIAQNGSSRYLVQRTGMTMNQTDDWSTISIGRDVAVKRLHEKDCRIYLRATGDFGQPATRGVNFSYSLDGRSFTPFGENFQMATDWEFFQAYRFAVFNYATKAIGGRVLLKEFALEFAQL